MFELTQELLDSINNVIKRAIEHGGDFGGPYFSQSKVLYDSIVQLLKLIDPKQSCKIVWKDCQNDKYEHIPFIQFNRKGSK